MKEAQRKQGYEYLGDVGKVVGRGEALSGALFTELKSPIVNGIISLAFVAFYFSLVFSMI